MDAASNRRWYQFNLRALLMTVTVVSIILGLRMAYLRWQVDFHVRRLTELLTGRNPSTRTIGYGTVGTGKGIRITGGWRRSTAPPFLDHGFALTNV